MICSLRLYNFFFSFLRVLKEILKIVQKLLPEILNKHFENWKRELFPIRTTLLSVFTERSSIERWLRNSLFKLSSFTALWVIDMLFWVHSVVAINLALIHHHTAFNISLQLLQMSKSSDQKSKNPLEMSITLLLSNYRLHE